MAVDDIKVISKVSLSDQLSSEKLSLLERYQQKVLGSKGIAKLAYYELAVLLFSNLPGSLGYLLRKKFFKGLFKEFGSGVILGQGLVLRHPGRMRLGDRVAIDDCVLLDASGAGEVGLDFGNDVIVSRNCVIQGKTGPVTLGSKVDIGCNVIFTSGNGIFVGNSVLIAGNCYIGGGRYVTESIDVPMMEQGIYSKGPIVIEDDVWLGAGVTVLDGVTIGKGSIIGAGAVVTRDIPAYSVAVGVPAKVASTRK